MHVDQRSMDRFTANVCPEPNSGCFLWMGRYVGDYGAFSYGRQIGAHVFSFVAENGEVPLGCIVHHQCNNPACVNPRHLEAKTASENVLLGKANARLMGRTHWNKPRKACLEPAHSIIKKFDTAAAPGTSVLAARLGIDRSAVTKWALPRESMGTGGHIPTKYYELIMAFAKEIGVSLDPAEFVRRAIPAA